MILPAPKAQRDLHGGQPDAAGGRMDEHTLPFLKLPAINEAEVRRLIYQWKRRGLVVVQPLRNRPHGMGRRQGMLGKGPQIALGQDARPG